MAIKVVFIGNIFGGDDGIGPYLYEHIKDDPRLKSYDLSEEGVIGFDLITLVEEGDQLIVVDAVKTESDEEIGKVVILEEEDLESSEVSLISQHDFGVEETAKIIRRYKPGVKKINIVGIKVKNTQPFSTVLSDKLMDHIDDIKKDVIEKIIATAINEKGKGNAGNKNGSENSKETEYTNNAEHKKDNESKKYIDDKRSQKKSAKRKNL